MVPSPADRSQPDARWGARTWRLEDPGSLSPLLAPDPDICAFLDPYLGMITRGTAVVHDAASLDEAAAWWLRTVDALEQESDLVGHLHTGPIAFMVMAEDGYGCRLIVPSELTARELTPEGTRLAWRTWTSKTSAVDLAAVREEPPHRPRGIHIVDDGLAPFCARVEDAQAAVDDDLAGKLIVARTVVAQAEAPIDRRWLLRALERTCPGSTIFCVDGLIGASPHVLLRRTRGLVRTQVLSGAVMSTEGDHDSRLAAMQGASSPVFQRHREAVNTTVASLAEHALARPHASGPILRRFPGVTHLLTDVTTLLADETDTFDLLRRLHPAVDTVGLPRENACAWLHDHERLARGRFGAPVGWIDGDGSCNVAVALRCGQLSPDGLSITLFAEVGVQDGLTMAEAVQLSEAKLSPMYDALGLGKD